MHFVPNKHKGSSSDLYPSDSAYFCQAVYLSLPKEHNSKHQISEILRFLFALHFIFFLYSDSFILKYHDRNESCKHCKNDHKITVLSKKATSIKNEYHGF